MTQPTGTAFSSTHKPLGLDGFTSTRFWWVRHAPVRDDGGCIYGQRDLPCDTSETHVYDALDLSPLLRAPSDADPTGYTHAADLLRHTSVLVKILENSGINAPAAVPQEMIAESVKQSVAQALQHHAEATKPAPKPAAKSAAKKIKFNYDAQGNLTDGELQGGEPAGGEPTTPSTGE